MAATSRHALVLLLQRQDVLIVRVMPLHELFEEAEELIAFLDLRFPGRGLARVAGGVIDQGAQSTARRKVSGWRVYQR